MILVRHEVIKILNQIAAKNQRPEYPLIVVDELLHALRNDQDYWLKPLFLNYYAGAKVFKKVVKNLPEHIEDLNELIRKRKIKHSEISRKTGYAQSSIAKWLSGNMKMSPKAYEKIKSVVI